MDFVSLAQVFAELETTSKRLRLTEDLKTLFSEATPPQAKILAYLCQGILVPEFEGIQLGIGDKLAEQAIAIVSGCSTREIESSYKKTGDLGTTAAEFVGKKTQTSLGQTELSVQKVYDNFFKIATSTGSGSQDQKIKLIAELLSSSSPVEAKVIVRFVIGNLRLGVGESTILDSLARLHAQRTICKANKIATDKGEVQVKSLFPATSKEAIAAGSNENDSYSLIWVKTKGELTELEKIIGKKGLKATLSKDDSMLFESPAELKKVIFSQGTTFIGIESLDAKRQYRQELERAFNLRSDLGLVAKVFTESGLDEIIKIGPQVFSPIRPALAERLENSQAIIDKIGTCAVEGKYDGLRLQIHKSGKQVKLYSRRQEPVTHMFPDVVAAVVEQLDCKQAIIEGEAIAYDEATGSFMPFQQTIQRKRKHNIEQMAQELPLKLFAFELLFLDGADCTKKPYKERTGQLEGLIKKGSVITMAQSIIVKDAASLERYFDSCIAEGLEGVIAKDINAPYTAGARKFAWIKLKRSYQGKLADTIDAVVVGYFLGKGKRTQFGLGGLLTAVYSPDENKFKSVAKVGSGFTEAEMQEFKKQLSKIEMKTKAANVESTLVPDVWVKPMIVVTLTADEITRSPIHACGAGKLKGANGQTIEEGLALRFPRLAAVREDKGIDDATTEEEIIQMYNIQKRASINPEQEGNL